MFIAIACVSSCLLKIAVSVNFLILCQKDITPLLRVEKISEKCIAFMSYLPRNLSLNDCNYKFRV